jgi:hypothetical protein
LEGNSVWFLRFCYERRFFCTLSTFLNKTPLFFFYMHILFLQTAVNTHSHFTPTQTHHINDEHNHIYKYSWRVQLCVRLYQGTPPLRSEPTCHVPPALFSCQKDAFSENKTILLYFNNNDYTGCYIHVLPEPSHVTHDTPQRLNTYMDKNKHTLGPDEWNCYLPWRVETLLIIQ